MLYPRVLASCASPDTGRTTTSVGRTTRLSLWNCRAAGPRGQVVLHPSGPVGARNALAESVSVHRPGEARDGDGHRPRRRRSVAHLPVTILVP